MQIALFRQGLDEQLSTVKETRVKEMIIRRSLEEIADVCFIFTR